MSNTTALEQSQSNISKSPIGANKLPSKTIKPSVPSRQPHIGAQSTITRINKCVIKNKKLYDYCLYAMKEVEKARAEKPEQNDAKITKIQKSKKERNVRNTVGCTEAFEEYKQKPNHNQNRMEKLQAKILPEDDEDENFNFIEDTSNSNNESNESDIPHKPLTRNNFPERAITTSNINSNKHESIKMQRKINKIANKKSSIPLKDTENEKKRRLSEEIPINPDNIHLECPQKGAQNTKLGICVEDSNIQNNIKNTNTNKSFNINMNLTMNSVEKTRSPDLATIPPQTTYYVPSPIPPIPPIVPSQMTQYSQFWSQNPIIQQNPYGIYQPYQIILPTTMLYNTQPYIMPSGINIIKNEKQENLTQNPIIPMEKNEKLDKNNQNETNNLSKPENQVKKTKNENSTGTENLASDLSNVQIIPDDQNIISNNASPSSKMLSQSICDDTVPTKIPIKDLSINIDSCMNLPQSALVTPKTNLEFNFSKNEPIPSEIKEKLNSIKEEPYMKRLLNQHAPRRMNDENMNKTVEVHNLLENSEEEQISEDSKNNFNTANSEFKNIAVSTISHPQTLKSAISFEIQNDNLKNFELESTKTLADIFAAKKLALKNKLEHESEKLKLKHSPKIRKERTKEEILEIRREMMKAKSAKFKKDEKNEQKENAEILEKDSLDGEPSQNEKPSKSLLLKHRHGPSEKLLSRLTGGIKPVISKKEMHDLTKKNYSLLPEVKEKEHEEQRKKEVRERIKIAKELDKKRRLFLKRRATPTN